MKKFTALFLLIAGITVFSNTTCYASAFQTSDEALQYISDHIMYKSMNFEGENQFWKASLSLQYGLTEKGEIERYNKLTLTPKFNAIDWLHFKLSANNQSSSGYQWQIYQNPIEISTYQPMPRVNEDIELEIDSKYSCNSYKLILKSILPDGIITATQAIQILIDTYYETYGVYPSENYTYYIQIYDDDWLIEYDDNDNIGGFASLLIDGQTGAVSGIKVEE